MTNDPINNRYGNASNIFFLFGGPCNGNCNQCFYEETGKQLGLTLDEKTILARTISQPYREKSKINKNSSFLIYPKEITVSKALLSFYKELGQKRIVTNGMKLDNKFLDAAQNNGIIEADITLFGNSEDQKYFNNNTREEYEKIKYNIKRCAGRGIYTRVNTILDKETLKSIPQLCRTCSDIGVKEINLLRTMPIGRAAEMDKSRLFVPGDMYEIIDSIEDMKKIYKRDELYFSFSYMFGPYFRSLEQASEKIMRARKDGTISRYLCPSVDNDLLGISLDSGNVYQCFLTISDKNSKIGYIDFPTQTIITNSNAGIDMSAETLRQKLSGNCAYDKCEYQNFCLGGCRTAAILDAMFRGEYNDPYVGMSFCLANANRELNKYENKNGGKLI